MNEMLIILAWYPHVTVVEKMGRKKNIEKGNVQIRKSVSDFCGKMLQIYRIFASGSEMACRSL